MERNGYFYAPLAKTGNAHAILYIKTFKLVAPPIKIYSAISQSSIYVKNKEFNHLSLL
jgi:hypothetical protein